MWDSDTGRGHTLLSPCTARHTCTGEGSGGEGRGGAEEEGRRRDGRREEREGRRGAETQEQGGPEEREGHGEGRGKGIGVGEVRGREEEGKR